MTPELLKKAEAALPNLPPAAQKKVGALIAESRRAKVQELAKKDFMAYVNYVWPNFIHGKHHKKMAEAFQQIGRAHV
jgi:hypothetical protein